MGHNSTRLSLLSRVEALPSRQRSNGEVWSGRRDSNPRQPAWKAGTLPLSYSRVFRAWNGAVEPQKIQKTGALPKTHLHTASALL